MSVQDLIIGGFVDFHHYGIGLIFKSSDNCTTGILSRGGRGTFPSALGTKQVNCCVGHTRLDEEDESIGD